MNTARLKEYFPLENKPSDRVGQLLRRYQYLLNQQYNYAIEWQELADYILPRKNSILVNRIPGWKRTQRLYDSTAPDASGKLASSVHSTMTPGFTKWFRLEMEDQELNRNYEVRNWLDSVSKKILSALNMSNYNAESHEAFLDIVTFGTGCLYEEEKPGGGWFGGLQFESVPIGKYVVSEGPDGKVDTLYRSFPMPLHAIITKWPDNIPKEILESEKPDEMLEVIHCVFPTESRNFQNYKWDSTYILFKHRTILSESGYYNFPYLVPRWTVYSDETYGRGPAHTALPDIRTLNKLVEMELRALAKVVDPPLGVMSGDVLGPARMIPGGITTVRNKDSIFPIETGYNYQVANLKKQELKESIEKMFHADQLQLAQGGPQMTATEVNVRFDLMQRILGPILGRIDSEFTKPLLNRTFMIMHKAGMFHPIPPALSQQRGKGPIKMKLQYEGSLARAQRASDITTLQQFEQITTPILKENPDAAQVVDFDEVIRHVAEVLDIPQRVIRDKEQVKEIRDAAEKVQQQQQQMEQAGQVAEMGKKVSPLMRVMGERPKPGSMMSKVA